MPPAANRARIYTRQAPFNGRRGSRGSVPSGTGDTEMLDAIMLAAGIAFFVLAVAYGAACDRM
jgi:hypothetical protein